jgi:hypothetical protein
VLSIWAGICDASGQRERVAILSSNCPTLAVGELGKCGV